MVNISCPAWCCPQPCALCCSMFSAAGVIMLIIVGALVQIGYTKIDNAEVTLNKDDREAAALSCYEAAAIYGAIMILCIIRYWVPTRSSVKKEDDRGWFPTLDNNDAAPMS
mmetsp:Transcript_3754/g.10323  ORF Transcript_3754/g.10323 Transcript_3754/m.10323 type:complete len:111 (-) Transcript_3754:284-616(-)